MSDRSLIIKDLPVEERPRERMERYGPEALSDSELLAILLRVGSEGESAIRMAERLLVRLGGLVGLAQARLPQLAEPHGMGPAKACQLKAAIELGKRVSAAGGGFRPVLNAANLAAAQVMEELRYLRQECLVALLLDSRCQLIRKCTIALGTLSGSPAHPREVFKEAIAHSAASVILAHNHPSGDPAPSRDDLALTERLVKVGELVGIPLVDHIIIGDGRFVSLKESGRI